MLVPKIEPTLNGQKSWMSAREYILVKAPIRPPLKPRAVDRARFARFAENWDCNISDST